MKVGVVFMPRAEGNGAPLGFAQSRVLARQVEESGFDSLWVYDHLLYRYPDLPLDGDWEAWTLLAAHAATTTRVEVGTLVTCTPFRNPGLLAKMAETVDEICGGRLIFGLGAGWHKPEFDAFGYPFDAKVDRFEEALQIIAPLLREGSVTFTGKHYSTNDAAMIPRGPRPAGPPIMIAAFGERMLRLTARYADIWNTAWYGKTERFLKAQEGLRAACEAEGRDPSTLPMTAGVMVRFGDDDTDGTADVLSGSPDEVGAGIQAFDDAGASHIILRLNTVSDRSLDYLAQALSAYRSGGHG